MCWCPSCCPSNQCQSTDGTSSSGLALSFLIHHWTPDRRGIAVLYRICDASIRDCLVFVLLKFHVHVRINSYSTALQTEHLFGLWGYVPVMPSSAHCHHLVDLSWHIFFIERRKSCVFRLHAVTVDAVVLHGVIVATFLVLVTTWCRFLLIPFLLELRALMDWMFTDTTLALISWLQMEDIFASVFCIKCDRNVERVCFAVVLLSLIYFTCMIADSQSSPTLPAPCGLGGCK